MINTIVLTIAGYCAILHILKRIRAYMPPCWTRDKLDAVLRIADGGGGPGTPV